jgi:diacylglycerol kinase family enzyme
VRSVLERCGHTVVSTEVRSRAELVGQVARSLADGATRLVAAGGDGTLQSLLDAVAVQPGFESCRDRVAIGAIGLGTSNDFHKPVAPERLVAGFPCRIDPARASLHDVIELSGETDSGETRSHRFLQASHAGTIAVTNGRLTRGPGIFHRLYLGCYGLALPLASLYTACTYRGFEGEVHVGDETWAGEFSGLTVMKRCHIAGRVTFATRRTAADGLVDLGLCRRVGPLRLLQLTERFGRQGFGGHSEVIFRETSRVEATFARPQPIDFDGELVTLCRAAWRVLPDAVSVLG